MFTTTRLLPLAAAVAAAIMSTAAIAAEPVELKPTDILTDGWQVNGYVRTVWRMNENHTTTGNEFNKADYNTVGTMGKSANQVEFNISKNTTFQNGVWSQLGVRAEYGNGDHSIYSSSGSEDRDYGADAANFEVKEAFIRLGGFSFMPENSEIWAGRRFLNREAGMLSGEFWKQSSGLGFGYEQSGTGIAIVSVDADNGDFNGVTDHDNKPTTPEQPNGNSKVDGKTIHSLDLYSYNHNALGGSWNFDLKIMQAGHESNYAAKDATSGQGAAITYKTNFYGLDGFSTTAIAYGRGLAANRGVNFGQWNTGTSTTDSESGQTVFFTSYGMVNLNEKWQIATEVTYLWGTEIWGLDEGKEVHRALAAARPSYKINDNFRLESTVGYGFQKDDWDAGDTAHFGSAELAAVFTVNSDFFGRPQIKPFVTGVVKDADTGEGWNIDGKDVGRFTYQYGVEAEIWF